MIQQVEYHEIDIELSLFEKFIPDGHVHQMCIDISVVVGEIVVERVVVIGRYVEAFKDIEVAV